MKQWGKVLAGALPPTATFWWGGINGMKHGLGLAAGNEGWKINIMRLRRLVPQKCIWSGRFKVGKQHSCLGTSEKYKEVSQKQQSEYSNSTSCWAWCICICKLGNVKICTLIVRSEKRVSLLPKLGWKGWRLAVPKPLTAGHFHLNVTVQMMRENLRRFMAGCVWQQQNTWKKKVLRNITAAVVCDEVNLVVLVNLRGLHLWISWNTSKHSCHKTVCGLIVTVILLCCLYSLLHFENCNFGWRGMI